MLTVFKLFIDNYLSLFLFFEVFFKTNYIFFFQKLLHKNVVLIFSFFKRNYYVCKVVLFILKLQN